MGVTSGELRNTILIRFFGGLIIVGALFFIPAGTLSYWQAWVYCGVIFLPMIAVLAYLITCDPGLLERRIRTGEKEPVQKKIIILSSAAFLACLIIPGLDFRFAWSQVPLWLVFLSDILVFCGYMIFFITLRENSYASRIIEVEPGQQVISTGPYAYIRHPMYSGMLLMFLFTPSALGSFVALITFPLLLLTIVWRIKNEETVLIRDLTGYPDYCRKVRYRLVPGIW